LNRSNEHRNKHLPSDCLILIEILTELIDPAKQK
jgi:hypothetical protein